MAEYIGYGIDLGTTNSCIGRAEGVSVRVYQNNDVMNVTPSVVRLLKTGRIIVGKRAYNALVDDPDNIGLEFKRWMGQKGSKEFPAAGRSMTAEELSAEVLKALKEDVKRADGVDLVASVVTVPAAFGALQCDATARACSLAGLVEAPLLQEPIAAAIAYGVMPGVRDQRWMVFDLGGGTLDIAVVSTRDGRLSVLEHRGNNLLGGKDLDRRLAENYLLPALMENYNIQDSGGDPLGYQRLLRRLLFRAEEAKIDLSSTEHVIISLTDIGKDADGKLIEAEIPLTRRQLEHELEPLMERALRLAEEALAGARIEGKDLDRVLLVGGPTQTPYIRAMLSSRLGAKIDHSIDPMTVVARGASLYAATIEKVKTVAKATPSSKAKVALAFEAVSAKTSVPVAGRIDGAPDIAEFKIDADGGYWSSGWFPVKDGAFEASVMLREGESSRFFLYARDFVGRLRDLEPGELTIRHGLVIAAPPLPHTVAIEVSRPDKNALDPIFARGTPLPAERTLRYRSDRACKPGEPETSLVIKLWEGEELSDPESNVWVGNVKIDATQVRRPIPEGSEVELTVKIDASRLITIEAFVPHLNQHFANKLYVAQQEEKDYAKLSATVSDQVCGYRERLQELELVLPEDRKAKKQADAVQGLKAEIDELDSEAARAAGKQSTDPDQAKRVVEASRKVRARLAELERTSGVDPKQPVRLAELTQSREAARSVVERFGTTLEKKELQMLEKQYERAVERLDERVIAGMGDAFDSLRWRVLFAQDWYWREIFESMKVPGRAFTNRDAVEKLFREGDGAIRTGDSAKLRATVRELWTLQPKSVKEQDQDRAMRSGLRRF